MTEDAFKEAKVDEVKRLIEDEGYDLVDVCEDWEWKKGRIPGARHVVLASIIANPRDHEFKDKTVFQCAVGERSAVASEMAVALDSRGDFLLPVGGDPSPAALVRDRGNVRLQAHPPGRARPRLEEGGPRVERVAWA